MSSKYSKFFLYGLPILMVLVFLTNAFFKNTESVLAKTSVFALIENVLDLKGHDLPDLAIESVSLNKITSPTADYNFYKYSATIVLHNFGGDLKDSNVVLNAGKNQKTSVVRTDEMGFSLDNGKKYIVKNYPLIFNGDYNVDEVEITLDIKDGVDNNLKNNSFKVNIFESDARIGNLKIEKIFNDGYLKLNVNTGKYNDGKHSLYVFTSDSFSTEDVESKHYEYYQDRVFYEYEMLKNSESVINSDAFEKKEIKFEDSGLVKFGKNPFFDGGKHYAYFMVVDTTTDKYAFSDILMIAPTAELNRAQFAKLFVDYAGIKLPEEKGYFKDVPEDQWYADHVNALFDLGLFYKSSDLFEPSKGITRGEVLTKVMDYYDVDLAVPTMDSNFEDILFDADIFPYAHAFSMHHYSKNISTRLKPELPATKNFLKYLVNAYTKGN